MAKYKVAFNVNGTVNSIDVESVKVGNQFLICFGSVNGDSEIVARIPFDSIQYITHTGVTVSTSDLVQR